MEVPLVYVAHQILFQSCGKLIFHIDRIFGLLVFRQDISEWLAKLSLTKGNYSGSEKHSIILGTGYVAFSKRYFSTKGWCSALIKDRKIILR